jgi:hypothetical protein
VAVDLSIRAAALSQVAARAKKAEIHARAFSWWRISSHPTTQSSSKRDLLAAAGPQYFRLEGNLGSKPQSRRRSCEGKKNFARTPPLKDDSFEYMAALGVFKFILSVMSKCLAALQRKAHF